MNMFRGATANEAWLEAAQALLEKRSENPQSSRGGETLELLHATLTIESPRDRWILSRYPAMNPAFAIAEVVWIISGRQDSAFLNFWNPLLPQFSGQGKIYYGAYGFRLRQHFGPDQISKAFRALESNPTSRQVVLQIWDPRLDLPDIDGEPRARDIPCNVCALLKVRDERLEWAQVMRSNDILLGLPHNVVQFTYLQEIMAAWLGIEVGSYVHFSDSLHAYVESVESLKELEPGAPVPENTDQWKLPYAETGRVIDYLCHQMDIMRTPGLGEAQLEEACATDTLESAAANMLLVVGADAARRSDHLDLCAALIGRCSNPVLKLGYQRWMERQASP